MQRLTTGRSARWDSSKRSADVVVVLGAAVGPRCTASSPLRQRAESAARLVVQGRADFLLVTGGIGKYPPAEAQLMAQIAVEQGLNQRQIVLEDTARSTWDNARECAAIIRERRWQYVILVTDRYHLPRSLMLFRRFGIDARGYESGWGKDVSWRQRWACYGREILALGWCAMRLLVDWKRL